MYEVMCRHAGRATFMAAALVATVFLLISVPAGTDDVSAEAVEEWECGSPTLSDVKATLYSDGRLVISGKGSMADYTYDNKVTRDYTYPWVGHRDEITSIVVEEGVTRLGNYTFPKLTNVLSVSLPDSLESIGLHAFRYFGTASITVPANVTLVDHMAFDSLQGVEVLDLSKTDGLTVGNYLTSRTASLGEIRFGYNMEFAEYESFWGFDAVFEAPLEDEDGNRLTSLDGVEGFTFRSVPNDYGRAMYFVRQPESHSVTYLDDDGSALDIGQEDVGKGSRFELAVYPGSRDGYVFQGWLYGDEVLGPGTELEMGSADIVLRAVWKAIPADPVVRYDHGGLVAATGDPDSAAGLSDGIRISEGSTYTGLPDTAGYRHVGWRVGDVTVGPTAELLSTEAHTAFSLWEKIEDGGFVPTPEDGRWDDGAFASEEKGSGTGGEGDTEDILLIAIIAVVIAELAVLQISRRR